MGSARITPTPYPFPCYRSDSLVNRQGRGRGESFWRAGGALLPLPSKPADPIGPISTPGPGCSAAKGERLRERAGLRPPLSLKTSPHLILRRRRNWGRRAPDGSTNLSSPGAGNVIANGEFPSERGEVLEERGELLLPPLLKFPPSPWAERSRAKCLSSRGRGRVGVNGMPHFRRISRRHLSGGGDDES
jgi:hypothetical protein